ncbi:hypothetical protein AA0N74_01470 [Chromobacterium vaccinii]|uniref:hypothetical protein n=1 Tax=Chromobacterium vaccinii TaxID=1108595 RepID=UPI0031CEC58C
MHHAQESETTPLFARTAERLTKEFLCGLSALQRMKSEIDRCERIAADIASHGLNVTPLYSSQTGLEIYVRNADDEQAHRAIVQAAQSAELNVLPQPGSASYLLLPSLATPGNPRAITVWRA